MATNTVGGRTDSAKHTPEAIEILDGLGEYINKATVLLRAAIATGAGQREDEAWLVGLAHDEMEKCQRRYREFCGVSPKGRRQ